MDIDEMGYWCDGGDWMCSIPLRGSIKIRILEKNEEFIIAAFNGEICKVDKNKIGYGYESANKFLIAKTIDEARNLNIDTYIIN